METGSVIADLALPVALTAIPFIVLALSRIKGRRPWIVAAALAPIPWGAILVDVAFGRGAQNANIGLGLLMAVWPFIVTLAATISAGWHERS